MINTSSIEAASSSLDTMHNIAFSQKKFSQITSILACDAGNKSGLTLSLIEVVIKTSELHEGITFDAAIATKVNGDQFT